MTVNTPFKVIEIVEEKSVQIAEFATYQKACLFVEQLLPVERIPTCSILEVKAIENKPLWDVIQGR